MSIDKLNFNNTINVEDEWFINENLDLAYLSTLTSDSVPSHTSTDIDSDLVYSMHALTSLHVLIRSSFMTHEKASDALGAFFKVPAKYTAQKTILFGRIESESMTSESLEGDFVCPWFFHYVKKWHCTMEKIGYDLTKRYVLNFDKGRQALLWSFVLKDKTLNYYHKTRRGLGYVFTLISSDPKSEKWVHHTTHREHHCGR